MDANRNPLAVVTGASSGIGLELARQFAMHAFDLVIAAEDEEIHRVIGWPVDALALNAGIGAGGAFVGDTRLEDELRLVDLNVRSTVHLAKKVGSGDKDDPEDVARDGFEALMAGEERVVSHSLSTKAQGVGNRFIPDSAKAELHRRMAEPGSAKK
jgi:short-subunit dehydrogenase